jgi:hypothetical protein
MIQLLGIASCTKGPEFSDRERVALQNKANQFDEKLIQVQTTTVDLANTLTTFYGDKQQLIAKADKHRFQLHSSGVFYRQTKGDESEHWLSNLNAKLPEARDVAYMLDAIEPKLKAIVSGNKAIAQVYYNDRFSGNRIYPAINVLVQYEPNLRISSFNFYYLADSEHNPEKLPKWVDEPYVDPAGRGWMISSIAPVYVKDKLEGVAGSDVTINAITENLLNNGDSDILIVHNSGLVIAASEEMGRVLDLPVFTRHKYEETIKNDQFKADKFNLFKSKSEPSRRLAAEVLSARKDLTEVQLNREKYAVASVRLKTVPWTMIRIRSQK